MDGCSSLWPNEAAVDQDCVSCWLLSSSSPTGNLSWDVVWWMQVGVTRSDDSDVAVDNAVDKVGQLPTVDNVNDDDVNDGDGDGDDMGVCVGVGERRGEEGCVGMGRGWHLRMPDGCGDEWHPSP